MLVTTRTLAALLLVYVAGCDTNSAQVEYKTGPGLLYLEGAGVVDSARIEVDGAVKAGQGVAMSDGATVASGPAVVRVGASVAVEVHTLGGPPSSWIPAQTLVRTTGGAVELTVRDSVRQGWADAILTHHPRTSRIVFTTPGPSTLVVRGLRKDFDRPDEYEYEIRIPVEVRE